MDEVCLTLGKKYRDRLHGIVGIATARTEYLTGCNRVTLEFVKDGEIKREGFDEPMLEEVVEAAVEVPAVPPETKDRGGPRPAVPRRSSM